MTEKQLRVKVVETAKAWLGKNEYDGSFKEIIDLYNAYRPLPVGYKVQYTDAWCATFASAVFIKAGLASIGFPECGCERMINLYKSAGRWMETDSYVPNMGDLVMYDWDDNGVGDNKGWSDHVGIVEKVNGNTITVIEGNYSNSVKRRDITVNARNIRGYCLPDFASQAGKEDAWYAEAQRWAVSNGISDGERPDEACTRAEVWAMLMKMR